MSTEEYLQAKVAELEAKLAARDDWDQFREAATTAGVLPRALGTAWNVLCDELGHQPGEPLGQAMARLSAEHDWLFGDG